MSAGWTGGVILCLPTLGIGEVKGWREIITDETVTFSSFSRCSHRQTKTHKWFLSYSIFRHFVKMNLCGFPDGDHNWYLVWSTWEGGRKAGGQESLDKTCSLVLFCLSAGPVQLGLNMGIFPNSDPEQEVRFIIMIILINNNHSNDNE